MKRPVLIKKNKPGTVEALRDLTNAGRAHIDKVLKEDPYLAGMRQRAHEKSVAMNEWRALDEEDRASQEELYVPNIEEKRGAVERAIDTIANQPSVIEHFTEGQLDILILVLGIGDVNLKD